MLYRFMASGARTRTPTPQHCTEEEGDAALAFAQGELDARVRAQVLKSLTREERALPPEQRDALVAQRAAAAGVQVRGGGRGRGTGHKRAARASGVGARAGGAAQVRS